MASVCASPGVGGKAAPPFANRLPARWCLNRSITIMRAKQVLPVQTKAGGLGGAQPPPPPFAHATPLSRVLKGAIWVLFCWQDDA